MVFNGCLRKCYLFNKRQIASLPTLICSKGQAGKSTYPFTPDGVYISLYLMSNTFPTCSGTKTLHRHLRNDYFLCMRRRCASMPDTPTPKLMVLNPPALTILKIADTVFTEAASNAVSAPSFIARPNIQSFLSSPTFDSRADDVSFLAGKAKFATPSSCSGLVI
jgi:hypothetical protein